MKSQFIILVAVLAIDAISALTEIDPTKVIYNDKILTPGVYYPPPVLVKERNRAGRIFGGSNVQNNERALFKHQVRLVSPIPSKPGYVSTCGGSLIDASWVITAAHCLWDEHRAEKLDMYFGIASLQRSGIDGETRTANAADFKIHPLWNPKDAQVNNDIALVRLNKPLSLNTLQHIGVVALPKKPCSEYHGKRVTVSGWGVVDNKNTGTNDLKKANINVATETECSRAWRFVDFKKQICASAVTSEGTCQGDSGGPMVHSDERTLEQTLIGLTSFGAQGCENTAPRVFTCVYGFADWIRSTTGIKF